MKLMSTFSSLNCECKVIENENKPELLKILDIF